MVRFHRVIAVALALAAVPSPAAIALSCTYAEIAAGICRTGGQNNGTGVDVWVDGRIPGGVAAPGTVRPTSCPTIVSGRCRGSSPGKNVTRPESVSDVARFQPRAPTQFSEPSGWGIVGVPLNFRSDARTHIVGGILLGRPAQVRFIPIRYRRDFGDATTNSSTERGKTWAELGVSPWAATSTSHAYASTGVYSATLVVDYVADYRFGTQAWTRLAGTVSSRANPLAVRLVSTSTVLVARPCVRGAIGCAD